MTQMTIMTGEDRRRKWSHEERARILAAAFAPGAVVAKVARQFDVASSLIYTWRREAAGVAACKPVGFSPAILIE
jgi:transposase